MKNIFIGKIGKILAGDEMGSYVKVVDDSACSGGILILTSKSQNFSNGFDNWVANQVDLEKYFKEAHWEIEWIDV